MSPMSHTPQVSFSRLVSLFVLACSTLAATAQTEGQTKGQTDAQTGSKPGDGTHNGLIQYPVVSPDARHIVFSAAGDLWSVPIDGGSANRLTSHPGIETQSRFNADGSMLVFESDRDGAQNLYTLGISRSGGALVAGAIRRVTESDRAEMLGGFSRDGKSVLFSAYLYPEIYRHPRMYRAPLDGGPITRITEAFGRGPETRADSEDIYFIRGYYYPHRVAYRGPGNLDIWRLRPSDGSFKQVTRFAGNDMNPCPLPDGSLVYVSSRDGQYNLVRLGAGADDQDAGAVTQLTHFKPDGENPTTIAHGVRDLSVSADGAQAAFVVWNTLYTLDLTSPRATPKAVPVALGSDLGKDLVERKNISREVSEAAPSPSGAAIAEIARGELFIRSTQEEHPTRRITHGNARERDIVWSPDGVTLYFCADDERSLGSIFAARVALAREDIEPQEKKDDKDDEAKADDELDDANTAAGEGDDESDAGGADNQQEPGADVPESLDAGKEKKEGEESKIDYAKRWATALRFEIIPLVQTEALEFSPRPSPDGTKLMYLRDRGDIVIRDLQTEDERVVSRQWSEPDILWASDSRHILMAASDLDFNVDIYLLDTQLNEDGQQREPINITQHPDIDYSPRLSRDGKVLTFLSDRDHENGDFDVYRVYLDRTLEGLRDYELAQYYEEATEAAKKIKPIDPVGFPIVENGAESGQADADRARDDEKTPPALRFDTDDAYLRVQRLTSTPEAESGLVMTPAADRIAFSTVIDGERSYVSVDYKGKDRKEIKSGNVSDPRVSIDGKALSLVSGGQALTVPPVGGKATPLPIDATIVVNAAEELAQKFSEASGRFGLSFYHPTMKGIDWAAMSGRYRALVIQTRTNQAFQRLMNLMFGEVDGSHTGIWGGDGYSAPSPNNGYLGIDFTPTELGYRIDGIIEGGPIDRMQRGPEVGDIIVAVGDVRLTGADTESGLLSLHGALAGKARDELLIEFISRASPENPEASGETEEPVRDADDRDPANDELPHRIGLVTPDPYSTMSVLRYQDEVAKRRALVDELSDGKLGYLHIRSMGLASVRDYERDLFAAAHDKEGLVIDVRDNGGGWTTDILLASLTAPAHAYTVPRGADPELVRKDNYPRDRRLIYGYSRPINVLINENSFSNAEIFAHAIKTIGRGKLIGTQTFGGVISTGAFSLIDGTTVRKPFRGWYLPDGTDMERHGAEPDIDVRQTPESEALGEDPQLEAAIGELLGRVEQP